MHGEGDLAFSGSHDSLSLEIGRSPVTDAIADHIDSHVGDGDHPQEFILQHIIHEEHLEGKLLAGCALGLDAAMVVPPVTYGRKSAGFRRVAYRPPAEEADYQGYDGREHEVAPPGLRNAKVCGKSHAGNGEEAEGEGTDGMGNVPDTHLETSFILAEPVRHYSAAWRPSESAEPAHNEHQNEDDHGIDGRVGPERNQADRHHYQGGEHEADDQELTGVGTVGDAAHDELAECISDRDGGHCQTDFSRIQYPVVDHVRGCEREVLSHQIICCVTKECPKENLETHCFVFLIYFLCRDLRLRLGRIHKTSH